MVEQAGVDTSQIITGEAPKPESVFFTSSFSKAEAVRGGNDRVQDFPEYSALTLADGTGRAGPLTAEAFIAAAATVLHDSVDGTVNYRQIFETQAIRIWMNARNAVEEEPENVDSTGVFLRISTENNRTIVAHAHSGDSPAEVAYLDDQNLLQVADLLEPHNVFSSILPPAAFQSAHEQQPLVDAVRQRINSVLIAHESEPRETFDYLDSRIAAETQNGFDIPFDQLLKQLATADPQLSDRLFSSVVALYTENLEWEYGGRLPASFQKPTQLTWELLAQTNNAVVKTVRDSSPPTIGYFALPEGVTQVLVMTSSDGLRAPQAKRREIYLRAFAENQTAQQVVDELMQANNDHTDDVSVAVGVHHPATPPRQLEYLENS